MSQRSVEMILGRLATDECFLRRFAASRDAALDDVALGGLPLNSSERCALVAVDIEAVRRFASGLDPRIQRCDSSLGAEPATAPTGRPGQPP